MEMTEGLGWLRKHSFHLWSFEWNEDRKDFLGGSDDKESACYAGDLGSIPGLGRSPRQPIPAFLPGESPRTEEPGRLQSQRVGHDWVTKHLCMRKGKILNSRRKVEPREEEGQVALSKKWMIWGWLLAISFIFVPITYGERPPCLSAHVEFWLLASSRSQQCNSRKRRPDWLPHSRGTAGASWLSAGCSGHLPNISPALLAAHGVRKCLVVDALCGLERWPFLCSRPCHPAGDAGRSGRPVAAGTRAIHRDLQSSRRPPSRAHFGGRLHKAPLFDWRWVYVKVINSN